MSDYDTNIYHNFVAVRGTDGRDLRDMSESSDNTGLLLSALCIEDGDVRPACLEGILRFFLMFSFVARNKDFRNH